MDRFVDTFGAVGLFFAEIDEKGRIGLVDNGTGFQTRSQVATRSEADGTDLVPVRPEQFRVWTALWAPDGSLAVVQGRQGDDEVQVFLVRPDEGPLQVLIEDAQDVRSLAWGP